MRGQSSVTASSLPVMLSNQRLAAPPEHRARSQRLAKVCLMIGQLGLGGTEQQLVLLAGGLHDRGLATSVLVMCQGGQGEDALRQAGVPVIHLGFRRFKALQDLPRNVAAFVRLVRMLRRERPDVLHAFLFHSYLTAAP